MAFTFNWAGVHVDPINVKYGDPTQAAGNFGRALAGYERKLADREYADLVESDDRARARLAEIDSELTFLRGRLDSLQYQKRIQQPRAAAPVSSSGEIVSPTGVPQNYPYRNDIEVI